MPNDPRNQARWRRPFGLILGLALVLGIVAYLLWASWAPDRNDYRPFDPGGGRWQDFNQDYTNALARSLAWAQDPKTIALRLAGFPRPDNTQPARVEQPVSTSNRVTVVIGTHDLLDDSVRQIETRVELVKELGVWKVEWAGERFLCYRGPYRGWTSTLCP